MLLRRVICRSVTVLAIFSTTVVVVEIGSGSSVLAVCPESHAGTVSGTQIGSTAEGDCGEDPKPGGPDPAPRRSTYCDGLSEPSTEPGTSEPPLEFSDRSQALGLYRYADGREDARLRVNGYELKNQVLRGTDEGLAPWRTVLVKNGGTPTHEKYKIWCQAFVPPGAQSTVDAVQREAEVWVALMTPNAVAESVDLFARVADRLTPPTVEFVDADADSGWLWVQVEHRVAVQPLIPIDESEEDVDETGWVRPRSVKAWLKATPVGLTIQVESDSGEKYLTSCTLASATDGRGCRALFTHSSSISDDGLFHGIATIEWKLSSNAGILDGLGPLYSNTEFDFEVAEAMAVTSD